MKLYQKIILINIVSSILLTLIIVGATVYNLSQGMYQQAQTTQENSMRVAWDVLLQQGQTFSRQNGQFLIDDQPIADNHSVVDKVKQLVGGTATIFSYDTRISTNVIQENGQRAIGTQLAKGEIYDTVLTAGQPYRGEADILGTRYFTAYDPIKDVQGEVIGILYVGVQKSKFFDIIGELMLKSLLFALLMVILSAIVINVLTRKLFSPLHDLELSMTRLASGEADLTQRLPVINPADEMGVVAVAFNKFMDGLQSIIRDLIEHTQQTSQAAGGLSLVSDRVAKGSVSQKEVVNQIIERIDQIIGTIQQVSDNAAEAENISRQAGDDAEQGKGIVAEAASSIQSIAVSVKNMAETVTHLGQRSDEISGILQVIQDIAAQTNLLALNAAIEAARAGEQGRGFAVVADEVRQLAERTSQATKQIKTVIESVQHETKSAVHSADEGEALVNRGVTLAEQAGNALLKINDGAQKTAYKVVEIAGAARDGRAASHHINEQIDRISQMAKDRAEISQEISTTALQLEQLSAKLHSTVEKFKV